MTFAKRLRAAVMAGEITKSVRIWQTPRVRIGGRYPLGPGHIEVTYLTEIDLDDVTEDLARETGSPGGAIYGTSSNGTRAAFLRPANASPVPGLFLVGGSAHPGGGLPLVLLSAEIVAGLIGPG